MYIELMECGLRVDWSLETYIKMTWGFDSYNSVLRIQRIRDS